MAKRGSGRPQGGVRPRNQGFTLIELLLVTVVVGVLASIFAPAFGKARERAYLSQMQADVRHLMDGVESYLSLNNGSYPSTVADLETGSTFTRTRDVQYCWFISVPRSRAREPYVIAMAGHPATNTKVFIVYPIWGSRMIDFDSGRRGC